MMNRNSQRTRQSHPIAITRQVYYRAGLRWVIALLVAILTLGQPLAALAQAPRALRIPQAMQPTPLDEVGGEAPSLQSATVRRIIIDTDPGVDDALALIWLLSQRFYPLDVAGIVTVAGNTQVDFATSNVGFLLAALGRNDLLSKVVQGANKPLVQKRSRIGQGIHGPDGLWGTNPNNFSIIPALDPDAGEAPDVAAAVAFYCTELQAGTLVLALGPLTNLAASISTCPEAWDNVDVVSLGGAKFGGNQTPTTEYNYWQDPEAAAIVTGYAARFFVDPWSGQVTYVSDIFEGAPPSYRLTTVPLDGFGQFTLNQPDLKRLSTIKNAALRQLLPAVQYYYGSQASTGDPVALPDVVAAIAALDRHLVQAQPALVKVLNGENIPEFVRGQTIIGLGFIERVTMIADDAALSSLADCALELPTCAIPDFDYEEAIGAILFSDPDNAFVVTALRQALMSVAFFNGLRSTGAGISAGDSDLDGQSSTPQLDNSLYLPTIQ